MHVGDERQKRAGLVRREHAVLALRRARRLHFQRNVHAAPKSATNGGAQVVEGFFRGVRTHVASELLDQRAEQLNVEVADLDGRERLQVRLGCAHVLHARLVGDGFFIRVHERADRRRVGARADLPRADEHLQLLRFGARVALA